MVTFDYWNSIGTSATTSGTWYVWSNTTETSSSTTYTTTGDTWRYWGTTSDTIRISDSDVTWKGWRYEQYKSEPTPVGAESIDVNVVEIPKETTEQKRAREAQVRINAEWRLIKAREVKKDRSEAEKRARELLLDIIGEDQTKVYNRTGRVLVNGNKYQWLITKDGEVRKITKTTVVDLCVCLQSRHSFPETDNVIAMALAAKLDEDEFLKKANFISRESMTSMNRALIREAANF
jgi:hypothetical protein